MWKINTKNYEICISSEKARIEIKYIKKKFSTFNFVHGHQTSANIDHNIFSFTQLVQDKDIPKNLNKNLTVSLKNEWKHFRGDGSSEYCRKPS